MRASNFLIVVAAAAGIGIGAYFVGHAVDEPAKQLDTVLAEPAQSANVTAQANLQSAISAAATYRIDHGTYAGMTTGALRSYDKGLPSGVSVEQATATVSEDDIAESIACGPDPEHQWPERDLRRPSL